MPTIRALVTAVVGADHVDEILKTGFTASAERHEKEVAANKQAFLLQVALAKAAENKDLVKMSELLDNGANPQGLVEEDWLELDSQGLLIARKKMAYHKSATAAVVWGNFPEGLTLLLTHPKARALIDLMQLVDQIIVEHLDQSHAPKGVSDATIASSIASFKALVAAIDEATAFKILHAAAAKYKTKILLYVPHNESYCKNARSYFDPEVLDRIILLYKEVIYKFGFNDNDKKDFFGLVSHLFYRHLP